MPQTPAPTAEAAATTTTTAEATTPVAGETVVDKLKASGQFTTLLAALDAAQLTDTLASRPAISIFAPTDAAFAAVPEAERTRLMDPANAAELRQLLLYHLIVADVAELLPELTLAQKWDLTVNELTRNVHTHPTLSEALQEAIHGLAGHMINF